MQSNNKKPNATLLVLKTATIELIRLQHRKNLKRQRMSNPDLALAGRLLIKTLDGDNMLNY